MFRSTKLILTIGLVLVLVAASAVAYAKEYTFVAKEGFWNAAENWHDSMGNPGTPGPHDKVIIPFGKTVKIWQSKTGPLTAKQVGSLDLRGKIVGVEGKTVFIAASGSGGITIWGAGEVMASTIILGTTTGSEGPIHIAGNVQGKTITLTASCGEVTVTDTAVVQGTDAKQENERGGTITITGKVVVIEGKVKGGKGNPGGYIDVTATEKIEVKPGAEVTGGNSEKGDGGPVTLTAPDLILKRSTISAGVGKEGEAEKNLNGKVTWVMAPIRAGERALIDLPAAPSIDPGTIDGEITILDILDEGVQVYVTDLVGPDVSYPITIFTKRDAAFLYIGLEIDDLPFASWEEFLNAGAREIYVAFDVNKDDDQFTAGDNILIFDLYEETVMDGFYPYDYEYAPDTYFGGTHDVLGAAYLFLPFGADNATLSHELLIPLDSRDRIGADPALGPGDEIDIKIGLVFDTFELETQEHLILIIL
jgi:hypothetical protein